MPKLDYLFLDTPCILMLLPMHPFIIFPACFRISIALHAVRSGKFLRKKLSALSIWYRAVFWHFVKHPTQYKISSLKHFLTELTHIVILKNPNMTNASTYIPYSTRTAIPEVLSTTFCHVKNKHQPIRTNKNKNYTSLHTHYIRSDNYNLGQKLL